MKESREKFLDRYRAISSASSTEAVSGDNSPSPAAQVDLTVSNEDIRLSVREVMRREWESMREEQLSLPQLPNSRASTEEYMEPVCNIQFACFYVTNISQYVLIGSDQNN